MAGMAAGASNLMIRSLYSLLASGVQPLLRRKLRRRGAGGAGLSPGGGGALRPLLGQAQPGALWIHAVSLGETRAAAILIERLRSLKPDVRILLTHGTATGRDEGEACCRTATGRPGCPGTRRKRWRASSIVSSRASVC